MCESSDSPLVERNRVPGKTLEIVRTELNDGRPKHTLVRIARRPQVESRNHLGVYLQRPLALDDGEADERSGQRAELIAKESDLAAIRRTPDKALHESCEAVLDLNGGTAAPQSLSIEVNQDKPSFRPERKRQKARNWA